MYCNWNNVRGFQANCDKPKRVTEAGSMKRTTPLTRKLYIEELEKPAMAKIGGGVTTLAIGEEIGGGFPWFTTLVIGEEADKSK